MEKKGTPLSIDFYRPPPLFSGSVWCGKSKIESKSVAPVVDHSVVAYVSAARIGVVRVVVFVAVAVAAVTIAGKDDADRAAEPRRPLNKVAARNTGRRSCSNHVALLLLLLLLLPIAGDVVGVKAAREEE